MKLRTGLILGSSFFSGLGVASFIGLGDPSRYQSLVAQARSRVTSPRKATLRKRHSNF